MPGQKAVEAVNLEIAARLRMLRQAQGLSQTEVGIFLGVSFQQVQKYEKGTNRIPTDKLSRLAGYFNVPVGYFFDPLPGPEGNPANLSTIMLFCEEPLAFRMAQAFIRLPHKSRRAAVEFFEGVASP